MDLNIKLYYNLYR